jgi:hypothetical protein
LSINPGFADVKDNPNNDADCEYYVILHAPPKVNSAGPKRFLGGVLIPWRYRSTFTTNDRTTISSSPTIKWTPPPYETFTDVIVDGDCEAVGTGSWTAVNSAILSKETTNPWEGSQCLKVLEDGTIEPAARQSVATIGKKYIVKGRARGGGVGSEYPRVTLSPKSWTGVSGTTEWQKFHLEVPSASSANVDFAVFSTAGAGEYCEFDDIEVLEATTVTPSIGTIYQVPGESPDYGGYKKLTDAVTDGDMELTGTTNWTAYPSTATVSKTTSSPQEGTRALRVTALSSISPVAYVFAFQQCIQPGRTYEISGYFRSDGTEVPYVKCTTAVYALPQLLALGTTSTSWQYFRKTFTANTDGTTSPTANNQTLTLGFSLQSGPSAGTEYCDFDNIKLLEVDGSANHRYNGANQLFSDWDMQVNTVAAYTDVRCTSSKDTSIYFKGTQSLKLLATADTSARYYTQFSPGLTLTNEYRITGYAKSDGKSIPWVSQDSPNST